MVRHFHKHKLLLDENFPPRQRFPNLNGTFDVKHLRDDFKGNGLPDPEVYTVVVKLKRLVVTFNWKDFQQMAHRSQDTRIIGISANLPADQIDTKLTALLIRSSAKALVGKFTVITGETKAV